MPIESNNAYGEALANSVADSLVRSGCFIQVLQNQRSAIADDTAYELRLAVNTQYSDDSAQNWATQWPGTIVFSTWWNGLLYFMDVETQAALTVKDKNLSIPVQSNDRYDIHYSSITRGVFSGSVVGWVCLTGVAFLSALFPTSWDDNMKMDAQGKVKDEYGKLIAGKILKKLVESESRS